MLNLPSLEFRRVRGDMIECFKLTHDIYDPLTTSSLTNLNSNSITRSHPFKLKKPSVNTNRYQKFFTNRIINHWNNLPHIVVTADTVNTFKNRLDKYWGNYKFCTRIMDIVV